MAAATAFSARKLLLCMGLTASLVVGTTACTDENSDKGTVVSITDGDTLVASVKGQNQTIRLLNIDTPETKDPNKPVECLGAEATDFLAEMLPVGTMIKLMYDVERTDKYGRTLAAVFTPEDKFVSAEIARAGLGDAVQFGKNGKFLPPVAEAQQQARAGARGIFDPTIECTLPAEIAATTAAMENAAAAAPEATSAATGAALAAATASITTAHALHALLQAGRTGSDLVRWAAYRDAELASVADKLSATIAAAEGNTAKLKTAQTSLKKTEDEAAAAKAAEAARKQAEARAATEAKAKAEADAKAQAEAAAAAAAAAAAEAERIRNLPPVYVPPAPPAYQPPAQNSGGGGDGYTGPRCYLPGGKTYRPC